ncbi:hypothetical protein CLAFUW4_05510 [Fulvia fulva]|uniref:Uncharacterized protein n=1 Tax=Passalora fulva TaxID=5499 RepID=A0A9Q8P8Y2_PASFU|nr:uncharacterized protein CLAFUR5_05651 [Fulvia fulva]KAK4623935.1 hypothetical protein CLAFUR4_05504 [Fulvia fulva]KAK4625633.1 hypothetical protein CLAFUR0_05512 [Fulvia fulva]UJO17715.1 hypothetical protein CLAFUR5_05651 [Fulvia fulva]WPV15061.1 hypothetical protein CLAFUW4_05510 [Fulvia fulva]WPV30500.1 hypothetical protein CLAFUW7_05508 [Fulvia fulva]
MTYDITRVNSSVDAHGFLMYEQTPIESTESYLMELTHGFADAINARDWALDRDSMVSTHKPGRWTAQPGNIWQHVDASYVVEYEHMACANTLPDSESPTLKLREQIQDVSKACKESPDFKVVFGDMRCEIDDSKGTAIVFANLETTGMPAGIVRQSVIAYHWRRTHGVWKCVRNRGIRGVDIS